MKLYIHFGDCSVTQDDIKEKIKFLDNLEYEIKKDHPDFYIEAEITEY